MLMQPLARKGGGRTPPVSRGYQTPAPIGGWNARDGISEMDEADARTLENMFPGRSQVRVRRGFEEHVTGLPDKTETLMTYANGEKTEMFAASNGAIYDVTTPGTVGSSVLGSLTNNRWSYVNMGTSGGSFIVAVNGEDTPIKYDGSSWSTTSITGVTSTDLIQVNVFKRRLFFVVRESLSFAYLAVNSIAGSASTFDLAPVCELGGHLVAMGTWTRDGGDGLDDLAVFYTSRGEVIVYQGTDPADADFWSMVGRFTIGSPVGSRCMVRIGGELLLISQDGFIPISSALKGGRLTGKNAISDKIRNAVNDAVRDNGNKFGWQAILYPRGTMILFNVPLIEGERSEQYVANTTTGSWCKFTGMNANCWTTLDDKLYFGGADAIYLADSGFDDNGSDITADCEQAPTYIGMRGRLKHFKSLRPIFTTDAKINAALVVNVDFESRNPATAPTYTAPGGATWDSSPWDVTPWVVGPNVAKDWAGIEGIGNFASIRLRLYANGFEVLWNATDWIYEPGGIL